MLQNHDNFTFWTYIFPVFRSIEFIIGIILGILFVENKYKKKWENKLLATLGELAVLFLCLMEHILCKYTTIYEIPHDYKSNAGLFLAIMIVYVFAHEAGIISTVISNRVMSYIGNISFEIYIIHQTVMKYCDLVIYKFGGENLRIIIITILTLILSTLFHYYGFNKKRMRQR